MASLATMTTATTAGSSARASVPALVARPRPTLLLGPRAALLLTSAPAADGARAARAALQLRRPTTLNNLATTRPSAAATDAPATAPSAVEQPISLTPAAMRQLERLRREEGRDAVLLRMAVRAGGCSGMSYDMKFEDEKNIDAEDDTVLEFESTAAEGGDAAGPPPPVRVAVDGKSLLFLFGMQIDYTDALVGGGFKFINPNSQESCGCGKSFSV